MKAIIKEVLDDMIKHPVAQMVQLKETYEAIGVMDANNVVDELLSWQKNVHNPRLPLFKNMTKDQLLLSEELILPRFKAFFEHGSGISEIFTLEKNAVRLNTTLTKKEVTELREYINKHFKVSIHMKGTGTKDV